MQQQAAMLQELPRQNAFAEQRMQATEQEMQQQQQLMQQQLEALWNLGTAQVARAAHETNLTHVKAFTKIKPFKRPAEQWLRTETSRTFKDAGAILDWAVEKYDRLISKTDVVNEACIQEFRDVADGGRHRRFRNRAE